MSTLKLRTANLLFVAIISVFLCAGIRVVAQDSSAPHDMSHMQSGADHGFMGRGMDHLVAKGVTLKADIDAANHVVTLREGPMSLPAHTSHMMMPQPPDQIWAIPFDGWLLAYHPSLVTADGSPVPGRVLHHTAFWNVDRSDFLCANKEEHIFGAGSEMTDWAEVPGFGYRVQKGDRIRVETMMYNPTAVSYENVYLEVRIPYHEAGAGQVRGVYPAWIDVSSCGNSGYDLPAGKSTKSGTVAVNFSGVLLGVGGHLHDYGRLLVLEDKSKKVTVATLPADLTAKGELVSVPVVTFFEKGGYRLDKGDQLGVTATYDNTSGKLLRSGAMGIVVGYFVPDDDASMASLRRPRKIVAKAASD